MNEPLTESAGTEKPGQKTITIHEVKEEGEEIKLTGRQVILPQDCPVFEGFEPDLKAKVFAEGSMALRDNEFQPIFVAVQTAVQAQNALQMKSDKANGVGLHVTGTAKISDMPNRAKFGLVQGGKGKKVEGE
jgi:hypothetical protein